MTQRKQSQSIGLLMTIVFSAVLLWALAAMVQTTPVVHAEDPPQIQTITVTSTKATYFYSPVLGEEGGEVYFNSVGGEGAGQVLTVTVTITDSMPMTLTGAPAFGMTPMPDTTDTGELAITYTIGISADTENGVPFTVTASNGLTDTAAITFTQDITEPTIISPYIYDWNSEYLHVVYSLTVYYGDDMGSPQSFEVRGYAEDAGVGPYQATYPLVFDDPQLPDDITASPHYWVGRYDVDENDCCDGTITVTVTDRVGNATTQIFTYTRDITSPTIIPTAISETSPYLYADSLILYYSDRMGSSAQNFESQGTASDDTNGAGFREVIFPTDTAFGDPQEEADSNSPWSGIYDVVSSDYGSGNIVVTATDNVGNWSTTVFTYIEDTTNPTLTLTYVTPPGYDEDNPDDPFDADGSNWYNADDFTDAGGGGWEFNSDTGDVGAGRASCAAVWDHSNDLYDQTIGCTLDDDGSFSGASNDPEGTVTVTVAITDHVDNPASATVVFNIDNTAPTITSPHISEDSDYLHRAADLITVYYGDMALETFTVNGSSEDTGVGLRRAQFSDAFGAAPSDDTTPSTWEGSYYPSNSQDWGSGTITVTVYDWLDNAAYENFYYIRDIVPPVVDVDCPALVPQPSFLVSWTNSTDPPPASGLRHFDVQYKVGSDGPWKDWHTNTLLTQDTFGPTSPVPVQDDTTYYFRVRAEDNVSNVSPYTNGEDATTYRSGIKRVFLPVVMAPDPNWGFETGDFTSWQHGGQLAQSVSTARPYSGSYSALLGSPSYPCNGVPKGSAWLRRSVTVPSSGSPILSFHYRIFTQDKTSPQYLEVSDLDIVPSGDRFAVEINGEQLFADANITLPEKKTECETTLYPTPHDLEWKQGIVPLNNYQGQTIEITFHNYNWPDKWYNTYTYIDDVSVQ